MACFFQRSENVSRKLLRPRAAVLRNELFGSIFGSGESSAGSFCWVNRRPLTPYGGLKAQPGWLRGKVQEEGAINLDAGSSPGERQLLGRCRSRAHLCLRLRRDGPGLANISVLRPGPRNLTSGPCLSKTYSANFSANAKTNNPANPVTLGREILKMEGVCSGKN